MATIKEIIQSFCYRINQPAPSSFVGVSSPAERQYLEIFRFIGDDLRNRPYQWPQLKRSYSFTAVSGQSKYRLPGDFYRILATTEWDNTNQFSVTPVSDALLRQQQIAAVGLQTQKLYRIVGPSSFLYSTSPYNKRAAGDIELDPAPDNSSDILSIGYLSANWVWPRDWVASTAYTAGDIRSVDRYVYICKTSGTSGTTRPSTGTADTDITDNTAVWRVYTEPYPVSSANSALNDNDLCSFDEDLMIEGMVWRYKQLKGMDFQQLRNDWENQLRSSFARFEGPIRFNMCGDVYDGRPWPFCPPGSWPL